MKSFIYQQKRGGNLDVTHIQALYKSTLEGANFLNVQKKCGNLEPGKFANFIVLKPSFTKINACNSAEEVLAKILSIALKKRDEFETLVDFTFYKGVVVFDKKNKGQNFPCE